jgi:uncharacterized protein YyaL (SSP411 family)
MAGLLPRFPIHLGMMASAAERLISPPRELVFVGGDVSSLQAAASKRVDPIMVMGYATPDNGDEWAFLADRPNTDTPVAYWCTNYACQPPESDPERLAETLVKA